ncbi:MAG: cytidine deaminase [Halobacteriales archaeon]|nr:cytidine deaminase [Halobacteriales archaeon]
MDELIRQARDALEHAYAPYSEYKVGAAVQTLSGEVFTGCNIEIANYSNTIHAEELAIASAVISGHREFQSIAVTTIERDGAAPCGMCRQTMEEFCDSDFRILLDRGDNHREVELSELLPHSFGKHNIK